MEDGRRICQSCIAKQEIDSKQLKVTPKRSWNSKIEKKGGKLVTFVTIDENNH